MEAIDDQQSEKADSLPHTEAGENTMDTSETTKLEAQTNEHASPRSFGTFKWICICVGLYFTAILYGLDTTIAADVQGPILEALGDIELLPWVGIGFPLGSVATILLLGSLFSTFEIKWLYLGSIILFEVGSAVCGAAPNMNAMIVGRVIAGIGGAGMYLGCLNYVAVFTSLKERALYTGLIGLFWGAGAILGPVIGGAFASSNASWRWSFYINLVIAAVTAPVYIFWFPRFDPHASIPVSKRLKHVDWVGAVLNAAMFALLLVVMSFAGSMWAWDSGSAIALWVVFGVVLILFAVQQTFSIFTTPEHRLFPVHFVRRRSLVLLFIATSCVAAAVFYPIYYVPLFFQFTRSDSAIQAAVRLLPFICVFVVCVVLSGALLPVFGRYMPWYLLSSILSLIGSILMYLVTTGTATAAIYGFEVLIAAGSGCAMQLAYGIAASKVPENEVAAAIGFINVAQLGSAALTLSVSGSIFQNLGVKNLREALQGYGFSEEQLHQALSGTQSSILSASGAEIRRIAVDAIVETISAGYGLVIGASALLVVVAISMRWEKLHLNGAVAG